jgi:iron complex outermembrane receptor protein
MGGRTRVALLALCSLILFVAPQPASAQQEDDSNEVPAAARRSIEQVEEVTVTARRRAERLEDTPVSVTAIGETMLHDAGVNRLNEITPLVPNLQFLTARTGQEAQVYIRGVGQLDQLTTTDPGVAIYVDGVYLARSQGSVLRIADIERVEVLRGPQGTLFGKNTAGGAINIITSKPTDRLEGVVSIRPGNLDSVETRSTINVPVSIGGLGDKLFSRFTFVSANNEGYTDNHLRDDGYSDTNALGFIGSLRYLPLDDLEFNLSGTWFRDHNRGKGGRCVFIQDPPNPIAAANIPPEFADECRASRPFDFESDTHAIADVQSYGTWGTALWNVGELWRIDELSVKSISAWRGQLAGVREDIDMTEENIVFNSAVGGGGQFDGKPIDARQVSQELQVNARAFEGEKATLATVAGFYAFWEDSDTQLVIRALPDAPQLVQDLGAPTTISDIQVANWSWAFFTQSTVDIIESIGVTAGFRYTKEKKGFSKFSVNPESTPGGPTEIPIDGNESETFDAWTPMASVSYRFPEELLEPTPMNHLMLYFTYSQGFKSGGFNGGARLESVPGQLDPYDQESVNAYEFGIKTVGFDRRASLNFALFRSDYDDIQVISTRADPRLPLLVDRVVLNAASATMQGLEAELELRPFTGVNLSGSVGLLDTEYDEFTDAVDAVTGGLRDRSGESFNSVPDFKSNLIAQYTRPWEPPGPAWLSGWITPRLQYSYQSSVNYIGPELPQAKQSGFGLLDARLSYDFNEDRTQVALWAKNLTDEEYFGQVLASATSTIGHMVRYYERPRTFGAEIMYRF